MMSENDKRARRAKAAAARAASRPTKAELDRAIAAALGPASPELVRLVQRVVREPRQ